MNNNIKKIILMIIVVSFAIIWGYFLLFRNKEKESQTAPFGQTAENKPIANGNFPSLESQKNNEGGVLIEATPIDFSADKSIQFEISLTTHQGDLDFDLAKQAVLYDESGNRYSPLSWSGGRGGHHLSGVLVFPAFSKETKTIKLVIKDVYGVKEREFVWNLK